MTGKILSVGATTAVVAALMGQGCAQGTADSGEGGTAGTAAGGTSSSGTGAQGGATGGGGTTSTTTSSPCGIDGSTIVTDDCHVAICNDDTGQCEVKSADAGTSCEDGLFCTVEDSCSDGICNAGPANDCGLALGDCDSAVCNESSKSCSKTPKPNGTSCVNKDNLCLLGTKCTNGLCTGTPNDCFYAPMPDECHVGVCNPKNGKCEPQPGNDGKACVDAKDPCTVNKTCAAGACQGGSPKDCSALTKGCVLGICDTVSGLCTTKNLVNGEKCDDLDPCTTGETCQSGQCLGGSPVTVCQSGDKCCPSNCTVSNDLDCDTTVPGFTGELGPVFAGWKQCEGYLDKANSEEIPAAFGNDCVGTQYKKLKLVCGASLTSYRYLDVNKNVFKDGLASYPESGLILEAKDQNGNGFAIDNVIYATGNHPHNGASWWNGGQGCGETYLNLTINNSCSWEASNCFGQGIGGDRHLWIYVQ